MTATEVIWLGLPGATHHYGGQSGDNVASNANSGSVSSPKEAFMQVLSLARTLMGLGQRVGFLPPQLRPYAPAPEGASRSAVMSSAFMWVANAATVTPETDSGDGALHLTPANLYTHPHRRIEAGATTRVLKQIFTRAVVHPPLASGMELRDEGAANHMRFARAHDALGLHVYVHSADEAGRQSRASVEQIAQDHGVRHRAFLTQSPEVVAVGVFHNDVIAVNHLHYWLVHERAYVGGAQAIHSVSELYGALFHAPLELRIISEAELSLKEAVDTYVFNSQIIHTPQGERIIIAPEEVATLYGGKALKLLERDARVVTLDLKQSMRNGGGPACLRLRTVLSEAQIADIATRLHVFADERLLEALAEAAEAHYPARLTLAELSEPALEEASRASIRAFETLTGLELS